MITAAHSRRAWLATAAVLVALAVGLLLGGRGVAQSEQRPANGPAPSSPTPSKTAAIRSAGDYVMALRWDVLVTTNAAEQSWRSTHPQDRQTTSRPSS